MSFIIVSRWVRSSAGRLNGEHGSLRRPASPPRACPFRIRPSHCFPHAPSRLCAAPHQPSPSQNPASSRPVRDRARQGQRLVREGSAQKRKESCWRSALRAIGGRERAPQTLELIARSGISCLFRLPSHPLQSAGHSGTRSYACSASASRYYNHNNADNCFLYNVLLTL